jgi:hypothetical protein
MEYHLIKMSAAPEAPAFPKISNNKSAGWVNFGAKNLFPRDIITANAHSPVNTAIIQSAVTYIVGKGVKNTPDNVDKYVGQPNVGQTWDSLIARVALDYKTFGGFYLQIIVNKGGSTVSVFHQDFSEVRIGAITDTGKPLSYRIAADWTKTAGKNKPLELEVWPGIDAAVKGVAYMHAYTDYQPGLRYYCLPGYYAALDYVRADGALAEFYGNSIDNGFAPSAVMRMSSNPAQEVKEKFQEDLERSFTGAKGASRILVVWGEGENISSSVEPYQASNNVDIYTNVEAIVFQKIMSAHRLASPTLAGVSGSGNLSGNAAEIIDAYILYNYTVIEVMRNTILNELNKFTKINGTASLKIADLDVIKKIRETEATPAEPAAADGGDGDTALTAEPVRQARETRRFIDKLKKTLKWR